MPRHEEERTYSETVARPRGELAEENKRLSGVLADLRAAAHKETQ